MSTQAGAPRRRRPERAPWLGHNAWWIQIAIGVAVLGLLFLSYSVTLLSGNTPPGTKPIWDSFGDWGSTGVLIGILGSQYWLAHRQRQHDRRLCIRCAQITPLDTQAAVNRHARALRLVHGPQRLRTVIIEAVLLLVLVIGWLIGFLFLSMPWYVTVVIISGIIGFGGIVLPWSAEWHRRLQPWCPQCRNDGGWDDDAVPEPSPDPQIRADR